MTNRNKTIEIRDIAKMLASAIPVENEAYGKMVQSFNDEIKKLPVEAQLALRSAYIFASRVPRDEREDLFQEFTLTLLKARVKDEALAYAIVRCDWLNFWRDYKRQHELGSTISIYNEVENENGDTCQLADLLVGESEFEIKINSELDAQALFNRLPDDIKAIVRKRLLQQSLTREERNKLNYYARSHAYLNHA